MLTLDFATLSFGEGRVLRRPLQNIKVSVMFASKKNITVTFLDNIELDTSNKMQLCIVVALKLRSVLRDGGHSDSTWATSKPWLT